MSEQPNKPTGATPIPGGQPLTVVVETLTLVPPEALANVPQIPGYEILGVLGEGGMGVVYKARQTELGRIVALKMIHTSAGSNADRSRFLIEARSIATLQHPNVVQIYEIGETDGMPFFSLEFCPGGSLDRTLRGVPMPASQAATLLATLAQAIDAAHQAKVIHRDLKPANVLLSADGTVKVADFGLAKRLDEAGQTQTGVIMGTPSYMAPEQAQARKDIGPLADVYALGAILYECLTGRPPFRAASGMDTLMQVVNADPVPPRQLNPQVPRDLEVLCMRCLEKEPHRRPHSAQELADELQRHLDGIPIRSRPIGPHERLWRWTRRHPLVAIATLLMALTILAVAMVSVVVAQRERSTREKIEVALRSEQRQRGENLLDRALDDRLDSSERLLRLAHGLTVSNDEHLQNAYRLNLGAWGRGIHELTGIFMHPEGLEAIALSSDGKRLVTGDRRGRVRVWDVASGGKGRELHHSGAVLAVAFDGNDRPLAAVLDEDDPAKVVLIDAHLGKVISKPMLHDSKVVVATFGPDAKRLITGTGACSRIWDVEGKPITGQLNHEKGAVAVALSADGAFAATATLGNLVYVWDAKTGVPMRDPIDVHLPVGGLAFDPRQGNLTIGYGERKLLTWVRDAKREQPALLEHAGSVLAVAYSPDGGYLLTLGDNGLGWVSDSGTHADIGTPLAHRGSLHLGAFSRDGRFIATACKDRAVRVWRVASRPELLIREHHRALRTGSFSPDGTLILTAAGGTARLWHTDTFQRVCEVSHLHFVNACRFAPDGGSFFTASHGGQVCRWSLKGKLLREYLHAEGAGVIELALSPDGRWLASCGVDPDTRVCLWDVETGERRDLRHDGTIYEAVFSPDSQQLLTGDHSGQARLWDVRDGRQLSAYPHSTPGGAVRAVRFSHDANRLITASDDHKVRIWDAKATEPLHTMAHLQPVHGLTLSRDGKLLATASHDATVRIWDAKTAEAKSGPLRHHESAHYVAFDPTGQLLSSAGADAARLWYVPLGKPIGPPLTHRATVLVANFDPAGKRLLTCGRDGTARLWPVPEAMVGDASGIIRWTERATGKTLDQGGSVRFLDPSEWHDRATEDRR